MAKLPDKFALGQLPDAAPRGRPPDIPIGALSAIGEAGAAYAEAGRKVGAGIAAIGDGLETAGKKWENENDQLEMARARSHFLTGNIELSDNVTKDPDYTTAGARYDEGTRKLGEEAAGMISNPRKREMFQLSTTDDVARTRIRVAEQAKKKESDAVLADAEQRINYNLEVIQRTTDPTDRMKIIQSTQDMIDGLKQRGILDERSAAATRQKWLEGLGTAWLSGMSPEQREEALRPYVTAPGDQSRAAAKNPRAAAAGGASDAPAARDYGGLTLPYEVPGIAKGMMVDQIKKAGVWDDLPKPLQERIEKEATSWSPLKVTKADLDAVPDKAWKKVAPMLGLPEPKEAAKEAIKTSSPVEIAKRFEGANVREHRGVIAEFIEKSAGKKVDPAQTAWCAAFVNAVLGESGRTGTDSLMARSFLKYGKESKQPTEGDIVVLTRGNPNGPYGHVGFYAGRDEDGNVKVLGGNQGGGVNVRSFPESQVLGFRKPPEAGAPGIPGMGGSPELVRTGTPADFISPGNRAKLYEGAQQEVLQRRTAASVNRGDEIERVIIDAGAGKGTLPAREVIENDPLTTPAKKNELLKKYDSAAGDVVTYQRVLTKFKDPAGGSFNPYDKDEKTGVDKIYKALGGENADPNMRQAALSAVVERTGIVPESAAMGLRGGLVSQSPVEVQATLQTLTRLLSRNPNVFVGVAGKEDFENAVIGFQHDVSARGMTVEAAAEKFSREQTSAYKHDVKVRIKGEDVDKLIKEKLSPNDLENAFDDAWFSRDPTVAFSHAARLRMFSTYAELTKDRYLEGNGDINVAKKQAAAELKKVWGVTQVNGSKVVMPYPPERSPGFAELPNASELIAKDAIQTIKDETGKTVERSQIRLDRMPDGSTEAAFKTGQPTPYMISYTDANGVLHILNPGRGRAFVPDGKAARAAVQEERRVGLEAARADEDRMRANPLSPQSIRKAIGLGAAAEPAAEPAAPPASAPEDTITGRSDERAGAREGLISGDVVAPRRRGGRLDLPAKSKMKPGSLVLPDADR